MITGDVAQLADGLVVRELGDVVVVDGEDGVAHVHEMRIVVNNARDQNGKTCARRGEARSISCWLAVVVRVTRVAAALDGEAERARARVPLESDVAHDGRLNFSMVIN